MNREIANGFLTIRSGIFLREEKLSRPWTRLSVQCPICSNNTPWKARNADCLEKSLRTVAIAI